MLYDYILENYEKGELIFAEDIDLGMSPGNKRQQLKNLVDAGKLVRYEYGTYYIPGKKVFDSIEARIPYNTYMQEKYIHRKDKVMGFYGGFNLINQIGLTSQVPFRQEIVTNNISTQMKRITHGRQEFILRKPKVEITQDNLYYLILIEALENYDQYAEFRGEEGAYWIRKFVNEYSIDKNIFAKYLPFYSDKIYKPIYEMRLFDVLA